MGNGKAARLSARQGATLQDRYGETSLGQLLRGRHAGDATTEDQDGIVQLARPPFVVRRRVRKKLRERLPLPPERSIGWDRRSGVAVRDDCTVKSLEGLCHVLLGAPGDARELDQ